MTPSDAVDFLNECLKLDRSAINSLFKNRVGVNDAFADSPHVIVTNNSLGCNLSVLGLLNGMLCRGEERIKSVTDNKTGDLIRFELGKGYIPL